MKKIIIIMIASIIVVGGIITFGVLTTKPIETIPNIPVSMQPTREIVGGPDKYMITKKDE